MRGGVSAFLVALLPCVVLAAPASEHVTMNGLGPVTLGMSVAEAEAALGAAWERPYDYGPYDESCFYLSPPSGEWPGVAYMVMDEIITRIDIYGHVDSNTPIPFTDEMGFGIGSVEGDIIAAYGSRVTIEPHLYLGDFGSYLTVDSRDRSRAILFETSEGSVTSFRTGLYPAVGYIEGCS